MCIFISKTVVDTLGQLHTKDVGVKQRCKACKAYLLFTTRFPALIVFLNTLVIWLLLCFQQVYKDK